MKTLLLVSALPLAWVAAAPAALSPGYVEVDAIHADIAMPYIGDATAGSWQSFIHTGVVDYVGNYAPNLALLVVNASTLTTRPANGTNNFDFMGVAAGEPIYLLSASQVPGQLYLGVSADYGLDSPDRMLSSNTTNYKSWDPDADVSGPTSTSRYVELAVKAVRGPGFVSIYDFSLGFGGVRAWVASADGLDARDELHQIPRSHSHYNWAFTQPGAYEIDIQARTFMGPDSGAGTEVTSSVETFHFQVVPEPGSAALLASGGLWLATRRVRRCLIHRRSER